MLLKACLRCNSAMGLSCFGVVWLKQEHMKLQASRHLENGAAAGAAGEAFGSSWAPGIGVDCFSKAKATQPASHQAAFDQAEVSQFGAASGLLPTEPAASETSVQPSLVAGQ
jgi:hypothetical protein